MKLVESEVACRNRKLTVHNESDELFVVDVALWIFLIV